MKQKECYNNKSCIQSSDPEELVFQRLDFFAEKNKTILPAKEFWKPVSYTHLDMLSYVPEFCDEYKTNLSLKVYGVGDHGGGPTRRDVEMIRDMMNWPIQPTIEFGTFHQFFHELEKDADQFPVVDRELNCVFTGCYTTQTRIKMANRFSEDKLYDAETLSTMAYLDFGNENHVDSYGKAWKKTLFNQFHDIIPGSGVMDTRRCV